MASPSVHLRRLRVRAYRSCKSAVFSPNEGITALIGPNGSGKTNLLQAILLLRATLRRKHRRADPDIAPLRCQLEADFAVDNAVVHYRSAIVYRPTETNQDEVLNLSERWNFKEFDDRDEWLDLSRVALPYHNLNLAMRRSVVPGPDYFVWRGEHIVPAALLKMPATFYKTSNRPNRRLRKNWQKITRTIEQINDFRSRVGYYGASQFTNPALCPTSLEIDEDGDLREGNISNSRDHSRFIYDLYRMSTSNKVLYDSYISLVSKEGLRLFDKIQWNSIKFSSDAFQVTSGGKVITKKRERRLIVPIIHIGRSELSFSQLSEGTLRTLALLFYVVTDKSSLLLIEEPEVCVHHGLLNSVIEIIKQHSKRKQIIFSTHSEFIVDTLEPDDVLVVKHTQKSGTAVKPISKDMSARQYSALKKYLQETGNLGEYWKQSGFDE